MHRGKHSKRRKKDELRERAVKVSDLLSKEPPEESEESDVFNVDDYSSDVDEAEVKPGELATLQDLLGLKLEGEETPEDPDLKPKGTVKGNPHIHIFWSIYNGFLAPSESRVLFTLLDAGFEDVDVRSIEYSSIRKIKSKKFDAKRAFVYCIKESRDAALRELVLDKYKIKFLSRIYYGLTAVKKYVDRIQSLGLKNNLLIDVIPLTRLDVLPSVKVHDNNKTLVVELMRKIMETRGLKILPGTNEVWALAPNAKYTYQSAGLSLSDTYGLLWSRYEEFSAALSVLQKGASWVLKQLDALDLKLFPEVKVNTRLIEFQDIIFDFQSSQVLPKEQFIARYGHASCLKYCDCFFDDLAKPKELLSALHKTIRPNSDFPVFLAYFGSLFRNPSIFQKALYVLGAPGTSKRSLTYRVLTHVFGEAYIGQVESVKSTFQFADIINKEIVVVNDFDPEESNLAMLQQLLDGSKVLIQRKNKDAVKVECRKIIFSSNESLGPKKVYDPDSRDLAIQNPYEALERRILKMQFVDASSTTKLEADRAAFAAILAAESLALAIFCSFHARVAEYRQTCSSANKDQSTPSTLGLCSPASWDLGPIFDPDETPATRVAYYEPDSTGVYVRRDFDLVDRERELKQRFVSNFKRFAKELKPFSSSFHINDPAFYLSDF